MSAHNNSLCKQSVSQVKVNYFGPFLKERANSTELKEILLYLDVRHQEIVQGGFR